jgi:dTDP-4-dehydrorhamnose 3,5-epimerase
VSLVIRRLQLPDVIEIVPSRVYDDRGFFSETWNACSFAREGLAYEFVQDNYSFSTQPGVVRGLHYQLPPYAQDKLVRVARGSVLDVAVDIRRTSPTFGSWVSVEISAKAWNQVLVPKGFAHGFLALEPETEVFYKVTSPYSPEHDRAIRFDDPDIGIEWPCPGGSFRLSEKDGAAPRLADAEHFH